MFLMLRRPPRSTRTDTRSTYTTLFVQSNSGKECVGIMEITEESFPDPTADKGSPWVVVRVAPVRALAHPVTLAAIKADPKLAVMDLIRQSRLSVGRVNHAEGKHIVKKSEKEAEVGVGRKE